MKSLSSSANRPYSPKENWLAEVKNVLSFPSQDKFLVSFPATSCSGPTSVSMRVKASGSVPIFVSVSVSVSASGSGACLQADTINRMTKPTKM